MDYVQGKDRPDVDCILCAVRDDDERVVSLKYYEDNLIFICLNLYPYNPGHSMIVPKRHVLRFIDLTKDEITRMFRSIMGLQLLFDDLYSPKGYNIGFNEGIAGATVNHCIEGYGVHNKIHTASVLRLGTDLPMIVQAVDKEEKIRNLIPKLKEMLPTELMIIQEVEVVSGEGFKEEN